MSNMRARCRRVRPRGIGLRVVVPVPRLRPSMVGPPLQQVLSRGRGMFARHSEGDRRRVHVRVRDAVDERPCDAALFCVRPENERPPASVRVWHGSRPRFLQLHRGTSVDDDGHPGANGKAVRTNRHPRCQLDRRTCLVCKDAAATGSHWRLARLGQRKKQVAQQEFDGGCTCA